MPFTKYLSKRYCSYVNKLWLCGFLYFLVLNSQPKLKDLYNLITPKYAAYWKIIGTLLGIENGIITAIERDIPKVGLCCNELLKTWLERDTNASWKNIIQVIDSQSLVTASSTAVDSPQAFSGN